MLTIEKLTYRIGPRVLLDQTDAAINAGHRVGLVGRNGTGKTTLLRLIAGQLDPDEGAINMPSRWRVGITSQEAPGGSRSLIDTVLAADPELTSLLAEAETATDPHRIAEIHVRLHDKDAHTANARAARILAGLGFSEPAQQRPCDAYSGGWRMRVALATLLFTQPDLLLLDEPTNHLDLEATVWLEGYLRHYPGTVFVVSHDRDLLNRAVDEILHLEHSKLTLYRGGYDRFERTRRERLEQNEKLRVKQEIQRAQIQKFVDRFRYKATKARQAQSRLRMLERMEPIAEHQDEAGITFDFPDPDQLAPPLYSMNAVSVGYDGKPVLAQPVAAAGRRRPDRAAGRQRQREIHPDQAAGRTAGAALRRRDQVRQAAGGILRPAPGRRAGPGGHAVHRARPPPPARPARRHSQAAGPLRLHPAARGYHDRQSVGRREGAICCSR